MSTKAFILLSGGLDSSTLIGLAVERFGRDNVRAVSVHYGQRHLNQEMRCAVEIMRHYGIGRDILNLTGVMGIGGLTDNDQEIPQVSYDKLQGVSPTYVPFRNGLLLSALASHATSVGLDDTFCKPEDDIVLGYGAHAEDATNWAYPDCTPEFIGAMAAAIYVGTYHRARLWTPLMHMTKADVVEIGMRIDVPYAKTWSCYEADDLQCGKCPTCLARKEAFRVAGYDDPTEYAS